MKKIFTVFLLLASVAASAANPPQSRFDTYTIIPEGDFQLGAQFYAGKVKADGSEFMMLVRDLDTRAKLFFLAPTLSYAYKDNSSVGVRLFYAKAYADMDNMALDLLNDGMRFEFQDCDANVNTLGITAFQRRYFGLDKARRCGFFCESALCYSKSSLAFREGNDGNGTTSRNKIKLAFSPGFVVFPMSGVSMEISLSMADVSYTSASSADGSAGHVGFRYGPDLMGLNFALCLHL